MILNIENQNSEWKESWRDEYLKWVCGFANADGGTIYIGVNDNGEVVGVDNAKRLSEEIPNKIRDILGIVVDVNIFSVNDLQYIEIIIPKYPNPINYKGQYHYRSGSTKQELKGSALNRFLLQKSGKQWDEIVVPNISIDDLSATSIDRFKAKATKSGRVDSEVLEDSTEHLLYDLQLIDNESKQLNRAAILLFHPKPERVVLGAYIKLGFFIDDDDNLVFQDEIRGSIMEQIDNSLDLLKTKYFVNTISYNGVSREENPPFPYDAIREILLNSITHKDYADPAPIQISVYPDHITFWNPGTLPKDWTTENLFVKHASRPHNPLIAYTMFRSGDIESWGRGYRRILRSVKDNNLLPPQIDATSGLMITLYNDAHLQLKNEHFDSRHIAIFDLILKNGSITNSDIQENLKCSRATATRLLQQLSNFISKHGESRGKGIFYTLKGE